MTVKSTAPELFFWLILCIPPAAGGKGGGGRGRSPKSPRVFAGVSGPNLETYTLFKTNTSDFPYPISDLSEKSVLILNLQN